MIDMEVVIDMVVGEEAMEVGMVEEATVVAVMATVGLAVDLGAALEKFNGISADSLYLRRIFISSTLMWRNGEFTCVSCDSNFNIQQQHRRRCTGVEKETRHNCSWSRCPETSNFF